MAEYGYDVDGVRVVSFTGKDRTLYIRSWSGSVLSEETQSATPACELYIYALGKIIAEVRGNPTGQDEKYYYYQDNLGSTMLLTQQNGCEVFNQDYLPFGESLSRFGLATSFVQPGHKYTGQHEDMGTGLYYYNARYYDPEIGRFTREDEYQGSLDRPQTQHAFAYVSNNPMKYIDPTGYANEAGVGGGVGDDKWFKQLIEFFANGHSTKDKDRDQKIERIYGSQLLADVLQAESEYEGFSFDVDDYMIDGLRLENQIQMYLLMHTIVEEMGKDGVIGIAEQKDIMITRMVVRSSFQYLNLLEETKSIFTGKADYYYSSEEIEDAIFEMECWYMFAAMAGFELAMMAASSENLEVTETAAVVQETRGASYKGTVKLKPSQMSNAELVQEIATRAENKIGVPGRIAGVQKHKYASDLLRRCQSIFKQDRGLVTEESWFQNKIAKYGTKGSVRIDVWDINTGEVWDYKFVKNPGNGLAQKQIDRILNHGPASITSITEVNP